jgi:chemotaxis protein MotB
LSKKKKAAPGHENLERWLLTYADLITLLLVFFIVLYSMSSVNQKKFEGLSQSLAIIFGNVGRSGVLEGGRSVIPGNMHFKEKLNMQNTEERVKRLIAQMGLQGKVTTSYQERGLVISIKDTVLFLSGSADLMDNAQQIIARVGQILAKMPNSIRVEGHTDNDYIHNERFFSNWELSTSRATNVLQYLIARTGIEPGRLSAAGYGEYRPKVPNTSDENKALNRRVDIVLLSSEFTKFEPPPLPQ